MTHSTENWWERLVWRVYNRADVFIGTFWLCLDQSLERNPRFWKPFLTAIGILLLLRFGGIQ